MAFLLPDHGHTRSGPGVRCVLGPETADRRRTHGLRKEDDLTQRGLGAPGEVSAHRAAGKRRRNALLEAAIELIGTGGPSAVTHRAVAKGANVPPAATTYYFNGLADLLHKVREHVARREDESLHAAMEAPMPEGAEEVADRVFEDMCQRTLSRRPHLIAHYEIFLDAARDDEESVSAERWTQSEIDYMDRVLESQGWPEGPDRRTRARVIAVAIDGLVLDELATHAFGADGLREAVGTLLDALMRTP